MKNLPDNFLSQLGQRLQKIYGNRFSESIYNRIVRVITDQNENETISDGLWNESDIVLITYGNSILETNQPPLETLNKFLLEYLKKEITCVHILPFFPYSSDDGFSVTDYYKVNSEFGDWENITEICKNFTLMADLVINHVSQHHIWFRNFLRNMNPGKDYFILPDENADLTKVVRPRNLPLLTVFSTPEGEKKVWTTFSADQVDLNFSNPDVLADMLKVFLFYLEKGARIIRLDAIAYLWKTPGTKCLHLPQTHEIVKLFRDVANIINPKVIILTETNVPNEENLSYFGDNDEAHMIYQFSLPPLLLHMLQTGNSKYMTEWASSLPSTKRGNTFFNFTASHDGIGVRPLEGLLPESEINDLLYRMEKAGGMISYKSDSDLSRSPYEINITYFDAFKDTNAVPDNFQSERFLCSQTIMMAFKGIPAFYIHSLLTTANNHEGVKITGTARSINRKKLSFKEITDALNTDTNKSRIFNELKRIINIRKSQKAFHPDAEMKILKSNDSLFAFIRSTDNEKIICISNITNEKQKVPDFIKNTDCFHNEYTDLISNTQVSLNTFYLRPYQTVWLKC